MISDLLSTYCTVHASVIGKVHLRSL